MKILLSVILVALVVYASGAYIQETRLQEGSAVVTTLSTEEIQREARGRLGKTSRSRNLNVGVIGPNDRELFWGRFSSSSSNTARHYSITYNSLPQNTITAFQFLEVGASQFASTSVVSGGIGSNNVTIRVVTAPGYGFNYVLNVWGY